MAATVLKWIVILLATINFSFMTFDGARALVKGDYIRPASGQYAGQLGPWSKLVKQYGIEPESNAMKTIFVVLGITGIAITICYALSINWSWKAMIFLNVLSLWYLFAGTFSSVLQIILLLITKWLKRNTLQH
jgi:hypothetical protein